MDQEGARTKMNPLLLPELLLLIAQYVDIKSLSRCALVSRAWNDAFSQSLWSCNPFSLSFHPFDSNPKPTAEAIIANAYRIRYLHLSFPEEEHIAPLKECAQLYELRYFNLNWEHLEESWPYLRSILERSSNTLQEFHFSVSYARVPADMWSTLSTSPRLKTVDLRGSLVPFRDLKSFWSMCKPLRSLRLTKTEFPKEPGEVARNMETWPDFFHLRELELLGTLDGTLDGISGSSLIVLAEHSPYLERFVWKNRTAQHTDSGDIQKFPCGRFLRSLQAGRWPLLHSLSITCPLLFDDESAAILDALPMGLVYLEMTGSLVGKAVASALLRHVSTLEEVRLPPRMCDHHSETLALLKMAPRLEVFLGGNIRIDWIGTELEPWVCMDLRELELDICDKNSHRSPKAHSNSDVWEQWPNQRRLLGTADGRA